MHMKGRHFLGGHLDELEILLLFSKYENVECAYN